MDILSILTIVNALCAIFLQALFPQKRHSILIICSAIALLFVIQTQPLSVFLANIPWDTILMLFALTIFGEFIFGSNLFDWLIKVIAVFCKGKPRRLIVYVNIIVFLVSSVLNNYQALLLILPILVSIVKMMDNLNYRYLTLLFSSVLVSSNLAGASTPIGDFPALYLLSQKVISFGSYFTNATPIALIAEVVVILVSALICSKCAVKTDSTGEKMFVYNINELYRNVKVDWKMLVPSIVFFVGMFIGWLMGVNPTVVSLLGMSFASIVIRVCNYSELKIKTLDSTVFVYFISLFIIIASIQQTGVLSLISKWLLLVENPTVLILIFSVAVVLVTGVVSAGPSTVVFFPIVESIKQYYPDNVAITCFCLSICAGSSLFLFSATAGPLLTRITEMAEIRVENKKFLLSFNNYLLPGVIGTVIIFLSNLMYVFINL